MTVLNPLSRIDERIMDDADLAGPIIFVFCFAMFLLLVCLPLSAPLGWLTLSCSSLYSLESRISGTSMASASLDPSQYTPSSTSCPSKALTHTVSRPYLGIAFSLW
jgi:hypothetical protein